MGSATTRYQNEAEGLTTLPDGRYLRDAIEKDPEGYLGPQHVARFGANPGVLIKLIDSATRIKVHLHPDDDFARRHLGCDYGKTEAWVVLAAVEDGAAWLGFRREVGQEELAQWRAEKAVEEMLATLHRIPVQAGAAILVPAGVPHAIGPGVLVLELQQPTDFGIALERRSDRGGDLGLGPEVALTAVDRGEWNPAASRRSHGTRFGWTWACPAFSCRPFLSCGAGIGQGGATTAAGLCRRRRRCGGRAAEG